MGEDKAIQLVDVSKKYKLGQMGYRTIREDIINLFKGSKVKNEIFWALKNISFDLEKGGSLGIIGINGAGKSTILKLLAGVVKPTKGVVKKRGKIGALIELSAGFHSELTGRENIYLYGSIIGLKKKYIEKRFDEIVEFSGLNKFLDTPLKRYSSGMYARLGFSVTAHLDPDILLVDEVLSVGDFTFRGKCINKMLEYKNSGVSIVFVSHNMDSVRELCDRTILLDKGQMVKNGDTELIIEEYYKINSINIKMQGDSNEIVEVLESALLNVNNETAFDFEPGDSVRFKIKILVKDEISDACFCVFIRTSDGLVVFDVGSRKLNNLPYILKKGQILEVCYELKLNLLKGVYHLGFNLYGSVGGNPSGHIEYLDNIFTFLIKENISEQGIVYLEARCFVDFIK